MRRLALVDDYPVERLQPHPRNYRKHNLPAIAASVKDGQHRTIAVRANDPENPTAGATVLAGHGVFFATRDLLHRDSVAASVIECSDDEAIDVVIRDNRTGELGGEDPALLADLLESVQERGRLESVGYTADDLDDLLAVAGRVGESAVEEFRGGYAETDEEMAARATGEGRPVEPLRQVLLVFREPADYVAFHSHVQALRKRYSLEDGGVTPVVTEAVKREVGAGA